MQVAARAQTPMLETAFTDRLATLLHPSLPSSPLAIALSGGADSLALTMLADAFARTHGGRLIALTVDHGLRPESAAEAHTVNAWMRGRGITHHILTPLLDPAVNNLQASARSRRYDALADFCRTHDILHCLVAHHAGDLRETVAHNTARGETADGGSGMSVARNYRGVRFLRPLLGIERCMLEDYLRAHNTPWIDDPSNRSMDFARVRTRAALATDAPRAAALLHTAQQEGQARAQRNHAMADAAMRCVMLHPAGFAEISLDAWRGLESCLATQLLADLLTTISGAVHRPRAADTLRLAEALVEGMPQRTLHQCEIRCAEGTVHIAREAARTEAPVTLTGSGQLLWDGRFHVHYDLAEGHALTLRALGKPLKRDGLTLPAATPSLWHLDECLFVPHINGTAFEHPQARVRIGFAPPKPLAAAAFWWLNSSI